MAFGGRTPQPVVSSPDWNDLRVTDVLLGLLAAAVMLVGTGVAVLYAVESKIDDPVPFLEPGEVAIAVHPVDPVSDASAPTPEPMEPPASTDEPGWTSTLVPPRPADAPPAVPGQTLVERPRGGIKSLPRLSTPKARSPTEGLEDLPVPSEPGFGPGGPAVAPGEADPEKSPDDPYAYVDPAQEDPGAPPNTGVVSDDDGSGEGNVLATRAVVAYRQRLQHWISRHFVVTGAGLTKEERKTATIRARIEISEEREVVGFVILPGGHTALEAAARRALQAVRGSTVPELPAHYPGPLQRNITITFTCTETKCD